MVKDGAEFEKGVKHLDSTNGQCAYRPIHNLQWTKTRPVKNYEALGPYLFLGQITKALCKYVFLVQDVIC